MFGDYPVFLESCQSRSLRISYIMPYQELATDVNEDPRNLPTKIEYPLIALIKCFAF